MFKISSTLLTVAVTAGLTMGGVSAAAAGAQSESASVPEIEWKTTLNKFQFDKDKFIGQRFTAKCLPASSKDLKTVVYGTDTYPSNNSICVAAVHAGKIGKDGGIVTVQLNPGASEYKGSKRNGIETASLPATPRSMVFVDSASAAAADKVQLDHLPRIKWDTKFTTTGFAYKQLIGQRFTFRCLAAPGNLRPRRIVGTDSYAFHSMVCRAAVHAGKIGKDGGIVSVQIDPGKKKLVGSIRNGIESKNGSSAFRTISFVDNSVRS